MNPLRYFFLSINILNCLLAAAVYTVANYVVIPLWDPVARISLPPVKAVIESSKGVSSVPAQAFSTADYAVISDRNLFHPERKIPAEKQPEKAVPKPDLLLYGTLITNDQSFAFVEDRKAPHSAEGRGKRQVTLKKGESFGGYVLTEIDPNRIVLAKGEERLVVLLEDKQKKRSAEIPGTPARAASLPGGSAVTQHQAGSVAPQAARVPPQASPPSITIPGTPRPSSVPPAPSSPQSASSPRPGGIGASSTWPPTQSSIEQTRQKILEGRQMRYDQIQQQQQQQKQ